LNIFISVYKQILKGPNDFIPTWGATCVGARKFLIAYNINLLGTKEQAHRIALNVREQGRSKEEVEHLQEKKRENFF
jgi:glutamate formiminotransferase/formiminotetrahydrofolate cyclodeaminase